MNFGDKICMSLLSSVPNPSEVVDVSMGDQGRVRFHVSSAFLSNSDVALQSEIDKITEFSCLSSFSIDSIGQLVVRKNFSAFLPILAKMTPDDYDQKLMLFNHVHFTICKVGDLVEFSLHVSYLHDALVDLFLSNTDGVTKDGVGPQNGSEEP